MISKMVEDNETIIDKFFEVLQVIILKEMKSKENQEEDDDER